MKQSQAAIFFIIFALTILFGTTCTNKNIPDERYTGSSSCIECHAQFYELWSTSHHGLAMQAITKSFIKNEIQVNQDEIFMEGAYYKAILNDTLLLIQERKGDSLKNYEVIWALGGKNVYYFLCAFEGGKLQTLPLAYNINTKLWFNNPESAIRHFPNMNGHEITDKALNWKNRQYTFNTSCYSCHVSQFSNNYDIHSNTYNTQWKENGINCETCHGPAGEHVKAARQAAHKGKELSDLKLIASSTFTPEQHNASCAPCHAKMRAISPSYLPGEPYFNNFDLITLESTDFYPDGRDLGENYTMTGWYMNKCAIESDLHCVTCHTSSGRYRYKSDDLAAANKACTSCHPKNGINYEKHSHHKVSGTSPKCIDCHMPMTMFGNMNRSDHSFRPPMPQASIEFGSPNACNLCHNDQSNEWAQQQLKIWNIDNSYQEKTLNAARLVQQARLNNRENIDEILSVIKNNTYGEVFTTSLLRLLTNNFDTLKKEVVLKALDYDSPLIRSAAADNLFGASDDRTKKALLKTATDQFLLVRLSAANALSAYPPMSFTDNEQVIVTRAMKEYTNSLRSRPDDWSSYYNLGLFYQNMGLTDSAQAAYETSTKIYPEGIMALINSSLLYSISGNQQKAEEKLVLALKSEPNNEVANFNYGLLMAEMGKTNIAEKSLRKTIEINPKNESAAYNLAILLSKKKLPEAILYSKLAMEINNNNPKFAYTYAFFLNQNNELEKAKEILNKLIEKHPTYFSSFILMGQVLERNGEKQNALVFYQKTLETNKKNEQLCMQIQQNIDRLKSNLK